jgi:hypothetical protein
MNFGFWNFYTAFNQNRMFTQPVDQQGHDWAYTSRLLGEKLKARGHQFATLDMQPLDWFDRVFFNDYPNYYIHRNRYFTALLAKKHPDINLILGEPEAVRPDNYDRRLHKPFRKVVTYKTDLVATDPNKYVLYQYPVPPPPPLKPGEKAPAFAQRKLCCMIQSYMVTNFDTELFSERIRAVRWFEKNAPRDFDLIGVDWDRILLPGPLSFLNFALRAVYRRAKFLDWMRVRQFPSFIGPNVKNKNRTLMDYRFCIGYENGIEKDWIAEKLFDAFHARCVPVYLGAPNITDYIPAETFIDKRNYTYEELYRYISTMPEAEYNRYIQAGQDYLKSPAYTPFTSEAHVDLFIKNFA